MSQAMVKNIKNIHFCCLMIYIINIISAKNVLEMANIYTKDYI